MDVDKVVKELQQKYPGKVIIKNGEPVSEILCEIEPPSTHPEWSEAIAVIDQSKPHYHNETTEEYEVLKGELLMTVGNLKKRLEKGEKLTIRPGNIHFATGKETWIRVYSKPGWKPEDHLVVKS